MIVLFIFFGDWRASLIVGSSIPISLLVTLIAMSFMGFSFNVLSLGGLVIGVGMMVDNSIVVIESCFRLKTKNADYKQAALEGAGVVASSILASTITTVVVFLPMAMIQGMSGQLFSQLCFTIVFSLIASLISALTVAPLVFSWLQPIEKEVGLVQKVMDKLATAYSRFLPYTFRHKFIVVLLAVAMLVGSVALVPAIGMELMPESDEGTIAIDVTTRPGLKVEKLDEKLIPLEEMVRAESDLDRYSLSSGVLNGGNERRRFGLRHHHRPTSRTTGSAPRLRSSTNGASAPKILLTAIFPSRPRARPPRWAAARTSKSTCRRPAATSWTKPR